MTKHTKSKNVLRLVQQYHTFTSYEMDNYKEGRRILSIDQYRLAKKCLKETRELENWTISVDTEPTLLSENRSLADLNGRLRTKLKKKRKQNKKLKKQCEEYRQKAESLQEHISKMSERVNSMLDPVKREEIVYGEPYLFIDDSNNKTIPNVVYVTYHLFHTAIYKVYFFKSVVSGQFITSTTSPKVFRIPGYTYPNVLSDAINPACH